MWRKLDKWFDETTGYLMSLGWCGTVSAFILGIVAVLVFFGLPLTLFWWLFFTHPMFALIGVVVSMALVIICTYVKHLNKQKTQ